MDIIRYSFIFLAFSTVVLMAKVFIQNFLTLANYRNSLIGMRRMRVKTLSHIETAYQYSREKISSHSSRVFKGSSVFPGDRIFQPSHLRTLPQISNYAIANNAVRVAIIRVSAGCRNNPTASRLRRLRRQVFRKQDLSLIYSVGWFTILIIVIGAIALSNDGKYLGTHRQRNQSYSKRNEHQKSSSRILTSTNADKTTTGGSPDTTSLVGISSSERAANLNTRAVHEAQVDKVLRLRQTSLARTDGHLQANQQNGETGAKVNETKMEDATVAQFENIQEGEIRLLKSRLATAEINRANLLQNRPEMANDEESEWKLQVQHANDEIEFCKIELLKIIN